MRVRPLAAVAALLLLVSCDDIRKAKEQCLADPTCNADFHSPATEDGGTGTDGGSTDGGTSFTLSLTVRGPGVVALGPSVCTEADSPCRYPFPAGNDVALQAIPTDGGVTLVRWWRSCSAADRDVRCSLTMDRDHDVLATFWSYNYAFVTSAQQAAGSLQSLSNADAICQAAAVNADLPGRFLAVLSTSNESISDRLADAGAAGWVRTDGKLFALDRASLFKPNQNTVFYPLTLDEHGVAASGHAATGTNSNGGQDVDTYDCAGYTSVDGGVTSGLIGGGGKYFVDDEFVDPRYSGRINCGDPSHLYCLGVDLQTLPPTPTIPPGAGRIFVSSGHPGDYGQPAFDSLCNQSSDGGQFVAFIAVSGLSAVDRFGGTIKFPLYRPDGVLVAEALVTDGGFFQNPADVNWLGNHTSQAFAWMGAQTPFDVPTAGSNCNDWSTDAGYAPCAVIRTIAPQNSAPGQGNNRSCGDLTPVYCVEKL